MAPRALLLLCLASWSLARPEESGWLAGLRLLYTSYRQCEARPDMAACLKLRAVRALDRALHSDSIPLVAGVSIGRSEALAPQPGPELDETSLPRDPERRQRELDEMLAARLGSFAQGHTLRLSLDTHEEGRKGDDDKKKGGVLVLAMMMKAWMVAMAFKGLAVLAGMALMVAKMALVLAGVAALSKLGGGDDGGKTTVEIVKHPHVSHSYSHSSSHLGGDHYDSSGGGGGGGHGWGRSLGAETAASYMAYSGQLKQGEGQVESVAL